MTSPAFRLLLLLLVPAAAGAAQMGSFLARYSELRTERVDADDGSSYIKREIARGETLDLAGLAVEAQTIEAGTTAPPRVAADEYEELMIVKSGELEVHVNSYTYVEVS